MESPPRSGAYLSEDFLRQRDKLDSRDREVERDAREAGEDYVGDTTAEDLEDVKREVGVG